MRLDSLKELYHHELSDLYDAEKQLVKAIPKLAKAANSPELKNAFERHLVETEQHVQRLERIFTHLDEKPMRITCKGMKGLLDESEEIVKSNGQAAVKDAGLIAAAQRVEHYEIAGYGCAKTFAELLGEDQSIALLKSTLDEERNADESLTELAKRIVNVDPARV